MKRAAGVCPIPNLTKVSDVNGFATYVDRSLDILEWELLANGVSPAIVERVMRLNPVIREGERLRGMHYKETRWPWLARGCQLKGWIICKWGWDVFELILRYFWVRDGRRVWVRRQNIVKYVDRALNIHVLRLGSANDG